MPEIHRKPFGIRQEIKAGNNFNGGVPKDSAVPLVATFADDLFKFAPGDEGGLFDTTDIFVSGEKSGIFNLIGVEIKLAGDQTSWKLERQDVDSNLLVVYNEKIPFELGFITTEEIKIVIFKGTKFKLTTVGATQAMVATLYYQQRENS